MSLVLFDLDGTLVDSQRTIIAAMSAACRAQGMAQPPDDAVRRIIGLSLADAIAALYPGLDPMTQAQVVAGYRTAFFDIRSRPDHDEPLFPGAAQCLDTMTRDGWTLGIATGKAMRGVNAVIERHGWHGRFDTIQTADHNPSKPNPGMVLSALTETGAAPGETVMVGDTVYDIEMGRSAGVRTIGVAWGNHPAEDLLAAGADRLVRDFEELPAAAASLIARKACV